MRPIYLASDSRARRELLKKCGLKFKVLPSRVRERRSTGNLSYAGLVKKNALDKAFDVAGRIKSGIVIAEKL